MSGILNKKIQLIDLVVTEEGRRQMSLGGLRPTYASFSDNNVDYDDLIETTKDSTSKLYFQTPSNLSRDQIIFETDDSGMLLVGKNSEKFSIINDDVYLLTSSLGQSVDYLSVSGSQFASTATLIEDSAINSFRENKFVRTVSGIDSENSNFSTSINQHTFVISNSVPFPKGPLTEKFDIDHAETFMFDSKLMHYQNF